ncbi:unnamed protein product [Victoria cruziana]
MKSSYHSVHEPTCWICKKHCRSYESLREHLIGPLPKVECARIFSSRGCSLCLNIFNSCEELQRHRERCRVPRASAPDLLMGGGGRTRGQAIAMGCKMVGGGNDGSLDICARVCLIDETENIIYHSYVKPIIPVTNYRYEMTGIRAEHLKDATPWKQAQKRIQDILYNGESIWRARSKGGKARILVGHGLNHDLDCLAVDYPAHLMRDTAKYSPLMKTSKLSNSLKHLTQAYLGYDIQVGIQDPYEDCVAAMRLYKRMRSQTHRIEEFRAPHDSHTVNQLTTMKQRDLEKLTPDAMLEISRSDYYCWCLDRLQLPEP